MTLMKKVKIELKEWSHDCADGCCHVYGTDTYVDGVKLPFINQDTETILNGVLKQLGYEPEITYSFKHEVRI